MSMTSTTTIEKTVETNPSAVPTVPVLPESAPFSSAQRAWLNGFFAGLFNGGCSGGGGGQAASAPVLESPVPQPATEPAPAAEEEFPWHDPALALDERLKLAEGKPRERVLMAAMAQLDCGACGYLCKSYAEAIACGDEKDLARCSPGGRDTARALKQLVGSAPPLPPPAAAKIVPVEDVRINNKKPVAPAAPAAPAEPAPAPGWSRNNPFPARLVRTAALNGEGSAKDTRHVVLDLRGSDISYKPGDALGVYPENCPDLVQDLLAALGASGAEDVPGWDAQPISLHDALLREFSIVRPSPDLLDLLSRCAGGEGERDALTALRDDDAASEKVHIIDLLMRFRSARPKPQDFVATLSPLAPRLYSISSSLKAHPGQVHLTVGAVRYTSASGRSSKGVCSTFLADRVRPGQKVRVFLHPSHKFGLPAGDRPIIMVGPGTGIAPFRAFLQERAAAGATGRNWLFFGDQKGSCDFLYREELSKFQSDGLLTRLETAFSRDQDHKVYVQDRMLEHGAELWRWLQDGAHFYVCGDARRMAADVDKALRGVIAGHGAMSAESADRYVAELVRAGRYQRDVY
jgi:sulfite reductase (NADPH) flavoprotein alpha-component